MSVLPPADVLASTRWLSPGAAGRRFPRADHLFFTDVRGSDWTERVKEMLTFCDTMIEIAKKAERSGASSAAR